MNYKIIEKIAETGMAITYKANSFNKIVVVKKIHPYLCSFDFLKEFEQILKKSLILQHPNIIHIFDYEKDKNFCCITMEYVEGYNLNYFLEKKNPLEIGLIILKQTCAALKYAHKQGVIHENLKAENILINEKGFVKITDFQMNHLVFNSNGLVSMRSETLSPEQIKKEKIDEKTDIFSLGAIFYYLFTGTKPFKSGTLQGIKDQIVYNDPEPMNELNSNLPIEIVELINKCLSKDPEKRFKNISEIEEKINSYLENIDIEKKLSTYINILDKHKIKIKEKTFKRNFITIKKTKIKPENQKENSCKKIKNGINLKKPLIKKVIFDISLIIVIFMAIIGFIIIKKTFKKEILKKTDPKQNLKQFEEKIIKKEEVITLENQSVNEISKTNEISETIEKGFGGVVIYSNPLSEIYIDGINYGNISLKNFIKLPIGIHKLSFKNPYCEDFEKEIDIIEGKILKESFNLQFKPTHLVVNTLEDAEVYLNEKFLGKTPFEKPIEVNYGKYLLKVIHPKYFEWQKAIEINPGRLNEIQVNLKNK
ncbi:MAG: serine/threonine-protein kinase [bacterium]